MKKELLLLLMVLGSVVVKAQWDLSTNPVLFRQQNAPELILKTMRTDNTHPGELWTDGSGSFSFSKNLNIGLGLGVGSGIIINGPHTPFGVGSKRDISFEFLGAGKSAIRSYRESSWGTALQFLTSDQTNVGGEPGIRMHINHDGKVGIGTESPLTPLHIYSSSTLATITVQASSGAEPTARRSGINYSIDGVNLWQTITDNSADNNFFIQSSNDPSKRFFTLQHNGYVGIGTTAPDELLTVAGKVHCKGVKVTVDAGSDFVFEEDYNLPKLTDVERFVKENKHLPEVPTACEMEDEGYDMGAFQVKLLQKIEELTLYTIEQQKLINDLKTEMTNIKQQIK